MLTDYETLCISKNEELAFALGWTYHPGDTIISRTKEWKNAQGDWCVLPKWTQDNKEAFTLMINHECFPVRSPDKAMVAVATGLDTVRFCIEQTKNHPNVDSAMRFAIVNAVLHKLRLDTDRTAGEAEDLAHALSMSRVRSTD